MSCRARVLGQEKIKRVSKGIRETREVIGTLTKPLIDMLNITEQEQRHLKTIIGTKEKYRRNNIRRRKERRNEEGLTSRAAETNNINAMKTIRSKDLISGDSKELGITKQYVGQIINYELNK